jgi:hypothetical protein
MQRANFPRHLPMLRKSASMLWRPGTARLASLDGVERSDRTD